MTSEQLPFYIGRYRVTGRLGSGGMGIVYLATDERLHRQVAIKRLVKNPSSSNAHLRIRKEALLLAQLNHANIVQIYDVVEESSDIALVMEYVDGCSLDQWQRERNPDLRQKVRLLKQISNGLARAHSAGIIHRDLKPDNILIGDNNTATPTPKITDFGIAKNWREDSDLTREQHVAGSWGAMSPEQATGQPLDNRSDLFALGVLAYRLLCEQNPFGDCDSPFITVDRIVNSQHPPALKLNPDLPAPLSQLLDRLLAKNPDDRPLNAATVASELDTILQGLNVTDTGSFTRTATATVTAEQFHRQQKPQQPNGRSHNLTRLAATAAVLLFAAGALALLLPHLPGEREGKYIAVVSPGDGHETTRETRLLTSSVMNALKEGLSNRRGLYLVPLFESRRLEGMPLREQAQALNAQLLLNPEISCGSSYCELSLEVIDTQSFSVLTSRNISLNLNANYGGFEKTFQQVEHLLPEYPSRQQRPQYKIAEADYRRYLELAEGPPDQLDLTTYLDDLEELQQRAPYFPPTYELYSEQVFMLQGRNFNMKPVDRLRRFLDKAPSQISSTPGVIDGWLTLAEMEADWPEADRQLRRLKSAMPDQAYFYHRKAISLNLRGEYQQALEASNRALKYRTSTNYLAQKAVALTYLGDMEGARPVLRQVLESDPTYVDATSLLAANELDMGNITEARHLLTSVERQLLRPSDIFNLCTAHYLEKSFTEADSCFAELLQLTPEDVQSLLARAEIARAQGQKSLAEELNEQAVRETLNREDWGSKLLLSLAYAQLGQDQKAVETLLKISREASDDIVINHIRAQVYITAGDLISAEAYIRRTLEQGRSPIWYQPQRFDKICIHDSFTDLRQEYPELCPGKNVAQNATEMTGQPDP